MSTVLVTGAFGNVGRHTVRALLDDGWHVVAGCAPSAVVHLAAVIPPMAYRRPQVAAEVNVEATRHLVGAVEEIVRASSADWMDTEHVGPLRRVMPLAVPLARLYLTLTAPRRAGRSAYAQLWPSVVARWGPEAVAPLSERP